MTFEGMLDRLEQNSGVNVVSAKVGFITFVLFLNSNMSVIYIEISFKDSVAIYVRIFRKLSFC